MLDHYHPRIVVCSLFRDSESHVTRTFRERARWLVDQSRLYHVCVEGDSVDDTFRALLRYQSETTLIIKRNVNKPKWGSVINQERFRTLAGLWNVAVEAARRFKPDYYLILDSDISVAPDVIPRLLDHNKAVIAPMLMIPGDQQFWDVWAYRADGLGFRSFPPFHGRLLEPGLIRADSVGVPLVRADVIEAGARFTDDEVVGFSREIIQRGFEIFISPTEKVYHLG